MRLISGIREITETSIIAEARIDSDHPMLLGGRVRACVAVELVAQAAALMQVFRASKYSLGEVNGYLLGARAFVLGEDLLLGDVVRIEASESWGTGDLAQIDGLVMRERAGSADDLIGRGAITVGLVESPAASAPPSA